MTNKFHGKTLPHLDPHLLVLTVSGLLFVLFVCFSLFVFLLRLAAGCEVHDVVQRGRSAHVFFFHSMNRGVLDSKLFVSLCAMFLRNPSPNSDVSVTVLYRVGIYNFSLFQPLPLMDRGHRTAGSALTWAISVNQSKSNQTGTSIFILCGAETNQVLLSFLLRASSLKSDTRNH